MDSRAGKGVLPRPSEPPSEDDLVKGLISIVTDVCSNKSDKWKLTFDSPNRKEENISCFNAPVGSETGPSDEPTICNREEPLPPNTKLSNYRRNCFKSRSTARWHPLRSSIKHYKRRKRQDNDLKSIVDYCLNATSKINREPQTPRPPRHCECRNGSTKEVLKVLIEIKETLSKIESRISREDEQPHSKCIIVHREASGGFLLNRKATRKKFRKIRSSHSSKPSKTKRDAKQRKNPKFSLSKRFAFSKKISRLHRWAHASADGVARSIRTSSNIMKVQFKKLELVGKYVMNKCAQSLSGCFVGLRESSNRERKEVVAEVNPNIT